MGHDLLTLEIMPRCQNVSPCWQTSWLLKRNQRPYLFRNSLNLKKLGQGKKKIQGKEKLCPSWFLPAGYHFEISTTTKNNHHNPQIYKNVESDLGVPVVRNPPANAGDMGWIPGPGRLHTLGATKPMSYNYWAHTRARTPQQELPLQQEAVRESPQAAMNIQNNHK